MTVGALRLTEVGTQHALVRFDYYDDCLLPAKSSVEIRTGAGGWREVDSEFTKPSNRRTKTWHERNIRLSGLRDGTRYEVRSRIDYLGKSAHTSDVRFQTGGDPARAMRAHGSLTSGQGDQKLLLSALVPDAGVNTPTATWVAPRGYEEYSGDLPWRDEVPYVGKLTRDCREAGDRYSSCTWEFKWRVSIRLPRPIPPFWWKDGLDYRVHFCIKNSVYSHFFGEQCTTDFSIRAGQAAQVNVGQAP